jgi:hypothetical protein
VSGLDTCRGGSTGSGEIVAGRGNTRALVTNMVVKYHGGEEKNGKGRVCVDFTDLNKACLNYLFPLPKIDLLVDVIAGHIRMSFLDAFQGYH